MGIIRTELRKINGLAHFSIAPEILGRGPRVHIWRSRAADTDLTTSNIRKNGAELVEHTVGDSW
jgi:hypothetical protein